jgi:V/A-type H+-transporting ATPase subunit I
VAIVKMKKVGLVGPTYLRDELLALLQSSALIDVVPMSPLDESERAALEAPAELSTARMALQRTINTLESVRRKRDDAPALNEKNALTSERKALEAQAPSNGDDAPAQSTALSRRDTAEAIVGEVERRSARLNELDNRLTALGKERARLAPWGHFEPSELLELRERGVFVELYEGSNKELDAAPLSDLDWSGRVDLGGRKQGLIALRLDAPPALELEGFALPERSLQAVEEEIETLEQDKLELLEAQLASSAELPLLRRQERRLLDELSFAQVRAGLGGDEELFALQAWCPVKRVDELRSKLASIAVVLLVDDPGPDDEVPILLENGPIARLFEPLLNAFALPHYRELDPTGYIAPFMGLFFGFCLGDLGYGVVLALIGLFAKRRFGSQPEIRVVLNWIILLGVCTILVGGLTGNVFGMLIYQDQFLGLGSDMLLFRLSANPPDFFAASLLFGVVQITVGMLIRLVRELRLGQNQKAIGTVGWLGVMPSIALWAFLDLPWAFVASLLLIFLFAAPSPSVGRRLGGGAWALYNVTGLFGDVMSYARIFGLGLSSGIIAGVVNTIAMTVAHSVPVAGWVIAVLILVGGHTFNFAMATIGSVVHPARLQFLEFFGKFFEGGGRAFRPFRKLEGE